MCVFVAAVWALVGQSMAVGNHLWHRRDQPAAKATTADHKIAQAIQQAVVNVVPCDILLDVRDHDSSPVMKPFFGTPRLS